jgi:hypothetical protein
LINGARARTQRSFSGRLADLPSTLIELEIDNNRLWSPLLNLTHANINPVNCLVFSDSATRERNCWLAVDCGAMSDECGCTRSQQQPLYNQLCMPFATTTTSGSDNISSTSSRNISQGTTSSTLFTPTTTSLTSTTIITNTHSSSSSSTMMMTSTTTNDVSQSQNNSLPIDIPSTTIPSSSFPLLPLILGIVGCVILSIIITVVVVVFCLIGKKDNVDNDDIQIPSISDNNSSNYGSVNVVGNQQQQQQQYGESSFSNLA